MATKEPKGNDLIIIFQKDGAVIVLDYGQYEQLDIPGKIQGQSVEEVIKSFAEQSQKFSTAGKRHNIQEKFKIFIIKSISAILCGSNKKVFLTL